MNDSWFLYLIRCSDDSLYCGITNNLEKRVKKHNQGKGAKYTSSRRPVKLEYSEQYDNKNDARKREEQIKKWRKNKKEWMVQGFPRRSS